MGGCGHPDRRYIETVKEDRDKVTDSRIQVIHRGASDGSSLVIFLDTKTGREFLSHDNAMVEIKPKEEK